MVLSAEGGFDGTVRFIFQPAEEHGRGALAMIADGLLERFPIEAVYGLHNMPGYLPVSCSPVLGRSWRVRTLRDHRTGQGGNAARPHMVIDPLVIGAESCSPCRQWSSRSLDPAGSAVLSCIEFLTDGVRNAIPGTATIRGDTRSFDPDVQNCWNAASGRSPPASAPHTAPSAP